MKNFKKINELFSNITKQIYKRHDNNFLIILDNWKLIVGSHLSNKSLPKKLNKDIFETIYYAAMEASMELSKKEGAYEIYKGSPVSKSIFQFDMWGITPDSGRWDWTKLKQKVKKHGVRNSLLLAPMPTASTSQILGNNECFEPYTSNLYTRRVLSGEFIVVNKIIIFIINFTWSRISSCM